MANMTLQSSMVISDIVLKNMWGTTSKRYDPKVGTLVCSDASVSSHAFHSKSKTDLFGFRNVTTSKSITSACHHPVGRWLPGSVQTWIILCLISTASPRLGELCREGTRVCAAIINTIMTVGIDKRRDRWQFYYNPNIAHPLVKFTSSHILRRDSQIAYKSSAVIITSLH